MVLAFTGWMDGGEVSTGTVEWLMRESDAEPIGFIKPEDFYIYSFPGPMDVAAMFRPHVNIENGMMTDFTPPPSVLYFSGRENMLLFEGREPNMHWVDFSDCLFEIADAAGIEMIYFVGSFGGAVPHTREPRFYSAVSREELKEPLAQFGVNFSDYEGPGSFSTWMLKVAADRGMDMATVVAEIPAYVQGRNPKSIEAVLRKFSAVLELNLDLQPLREDTDIWERKLNEVVEEREDLLEHIQQLEQDYDNEVFDTQMGDLKNWLKQRGVRLD